MKNKISSGFIAFRMLSLILSAAFIINLLPGLGTVFSARASDYTGQVVKITTYAGAYQDIVNGDELNAFTDYGDSGRNWTYAFSNCSDTAHPDNNKINYAYSTGAARPGEYLAFRINIPYSGVFRPLLEYYSYSRTGIVGVYLAPLPDSETDARLLDELTETNAYKLGEADTYSPDIKVDKIGFEETELSAGEYLLIYKAEGKNPAASNCWMLVRELMLDGRDPSEVHEYSGDTITIKLPPKMGQTRLETYANVNEYFADNTEYDLPTRPWAYVDGTYNTSDTSGNIIGPTYIQLANMIGGWVAFKINVETPGRYKASFTYLSQKNNGAVIGVYSAPYDESKPGGYSREEIAALINPYNRYGQVNTRDVNTEVQTADIDDIAFEQAGSYFIIFRGDAMGRYNYSGSGTYMFPQGLELNGIVYDLSTAIISLDRSTISVGESTTVTAVGYLSSGQVAKGAEITYQSLTPEIAVVDRESGLINAVSEGVAAIRAVIKLGEVEIVKEINLMVADIEPEEPAELAGVVAEYDFRRGVYNEDVSAGMGSDVRTYTSYGEERAWAYVNDTISETVAEPVQMLANFTQIFSKTGEWVAFKIQVTNPGRYRATLDMYCRNTAAKINFYKLEITEETKTDSISIESYLTSENRFSTVDAYQATAAVESKYMGEAVFENRGEYLLIMQASTDNPTSRRYMYPAKLILDGTSLAEVTLGLESEHIGVNESIFAYVIQGILESGGRADISGATISYSSSNPEIAGIDAKTGKITGVSAGTAEISVTVEMDGVVKSDKLYITVDLEYGVDRIEINSSSVSTVGQTMLLSAAARLSNGDRLSIPIEDMSFEIVSQDPVGIASLSGLQLTTTGAGFVTVRATATVRGNSFTSGDFRIDIYEKQESEHQKRWVFNGASGMTIDGRLLTAPARDRDWVYYADNLTAESDAITMLSSCMQIVIKGPGQWVAYKTAISEVGSYFASTGFYSASGGGTTQYYILPYTGQTEQDITAQLNATQPIGEYNGKGSAGNGHADLGEVIIPHAGEYLIVVRSVSGNIYQRELILSGSKSLKEIDFSVGDGDTVEFNQNANITVTANRLDGTELDVSQIELIYRSAKASIASVDGNGQVSASFPGTTEIIVKAFYKGAYIEKVKEITVIDRSEMRGATLVVPEVVYINQKATLSASAEMLNGNIFTLPEDSARYVIVSSSPGNAAVIDGNILTGNQTGTVTVKAIIDYCGNTRETEEKTVRILISGKTSSTIYTDEVKAVVRENIKNYSWAKNELDTAIKAAEKYIDKDDLLWSLPVAEGLPRYYHIAEKYDPDKFICPYCRADIAAKYSAYGWVTSALTSPWKIQCPDCKRRFPSNDFGNYYRIGLNENGVFDPDIANLNNNELVAKGEKGYLYNQLYPEKGEGWGVDDGFGYFTGKVHANGVVERHNYIAYYLHNALWYCNSPKYGSQTIRDALWSLSKAYVYTGESKYARSGAILLDRIADLYPDYKWEIWKTWRPDSYRGKILDSGWECQLARDFIDAYDAFYPIYDDPYVINFLSDKAEKYNLSPKNTKQALTQNVENNILRTVYNSAVDYEIGGGFGIIQRAIITGAVVLDSQPETDEWLEWTFAPEIAPDVRKAPRTGGDVLRTLMDSTTSVDRDGNGYQAAPGYNRSWMDSFIILGEVIANNGNYEKYNVYNNPKFAKLFTAQMEYTLGNYYTPQIGDSGAVASTGLTSDQVLDTLIMAFYRLKTPAIAQLIYKCNNNSTDGLRYGITVENPESLADEIRDVIKKYGEMKLKSKMLTGYGMAILRDGDIYKSADPGTEINNTTDYAIYFGRNTAHGHDDQLNLFIDAYGLNMAPDLGYPEQTGTQPNRIQFVDQVLSHNTVQVNGRTHGNIVHGTPYHFDDSGIVKIMDIDSPTIYPNTDTYRRTVVMVKANEDTSYAVDFFRVKGGNDHVYSFHSQSKKIHETKGLNLVPQVNENNEYIGTYAGPDVPYGPDPYTNLNSSSDGYLKYPTGFTWLKNVRKEENPPANFEVDFDVTDFRRVLKGKGNNLHLRLTMISDGYELSDFAITTTLPPNVATNIQNGIDSLEYIIARRKGSNLDTLFTTVFEPYKKTRY
ncbi:MAG: hypothetical protein GX541_03655, partial [Clostridiales bacterium]|nr:hypothetical protein [Clostridiales bacterium]